MNCEKCGTRLIVTNVIVEPTEKFRRLVCPSCHTPYSTHEIILASLPERGQGYRALASKAKKASAAPEPPTKSPRR